jgi:hypothetical protein
MSSRPSDRAAFAAAAASAGETARAARAYEIDDVYERQASVSHITSQPARSDRDLGPGLEFYRRQAAAVAAAEKAAEEAAAAAAAQPRIQSGQITDRPQQAAPVNPHGRTIWSGSAVTALPAPKRQAFNILDDSTGKPDPTERH